MAIKIWRGDAQGVAQVTKVTISNVEVGDVFTLTVNRKSVSFTATEEGDPTGIDEVITGLAAAWEASTEDELESVSASATDTTTDTTDAGYGYKDTLVLTGGSDGGVRRARCSMRARRARTRNRRSHSPDLQRAALSPSPSRATRRATLRTTPAPPRSKPRLKA